jgi:starvation-inducible outer membrane lipoprotein
MILSILVLSACSSTPEAALKSESTDIIQLIEQAKEDFLKL